MAGQNQGTKGFPARRAAMRLLDTVLRRGETLDQAFHSATSDMRDGSDKALARAIASETLRWLVDLDALIDSATKKILPQDARPRMVLRLMLAQALRLETPAHAVIATALPLLSSGPRRLAHGVFSHLMKQEVSLPDAPTLPMQAIERWGDFSPIVAAGIAEPPPLDLALRDVSETQHWANQLAAESYAPGHLRLPRGSAVETLEGFNEGAWWVQDLAATIPVRLLGAGEADGTRKHALDLCAAPGGKTMQLAAAGWNVTALDRSKRRLDTLKENLKRTGLKASPVRADALTWEPKHQFDAILLDAPCTATGTCRRHPDVLHRIGEAQIEEMTQLQSALLERAVEWLKPGGTLVYAVCSLEREEGEMQADNVKLEPHPIAAEELPEGVEVGQEGLKPHHLRTHPGMLSEQGGLDGFFIARWKK